MTMPPPCDISDSALLPLTCTGVPDVVLVEFPFVVPVAFGDDPVAEALPLDVEFDFPVSFVALEELVSDWKPCQLMFSSCFRTIDAYLSRHNASGEDYEEDA